MSVPDRRVLLVHSPFVAPDCWEPVAVHLRQKGLAVGLGDLSPVLSDPDFWATAGAHIEGVAARSSAVVLHSGAGLLAPVIPAGPALVFVDALLPRVGPDWWSTVPAALRTRLESLVVDDQLPPWSRWWDESVLAMLLPDAGAREHFDRGCPPIPMSLLRSPLPSATAWKSRPAGYLRLSGGYDDEMAIAGDLGMATELHDGSHLSLVTEGSAVGDGIIRLLDRLGG